MSDQKVKILIRNNETGEIVERLCDFTGNHPEDIDGEINYFWWSEGNMSCDCNRGMEFSRSKKINEENIPDYECGDDRFSIQIVQLSNNEIIYDEFSEVKS